MIKSKMNVKTKKGCVILRFKYVLFDLDGTLIDTNKLILDSFKHTIKEHLDIDVFDEDLLKYFGEPLIYTLQRYSMEKSHKMFETYIRYNEHHHDNCVLPCEGIEDGLAKLKDLGCTMAIVTSKRRDIATRGLKLFGFEKYFSTIVALEDTEKHKPDAGPIIEALRRLNADGGQAIMIGDSIYDIECAKNAGIKSMLVKWSMADGFQDRKIDADYIVNSIEELIDIIEE